MHANENIFVCSEYECQNRKQSNNEALAVTTIGDSHRTISHSQTLIPTTLWLPHHHQTCKCVQFIPTLSSLLHPHDALIMIACKPPPEVGVTNYSYASKSSKFSQKTPKNPTQTSNASFACLLAEQVDDDDGKKMLWLNFFQHTNVWTETKTKTFTIICSSSLSFSSRA